MKKEYDTSVKEAIERVMSVFSSTSKQLHTSILYGLVRSGISTSASIVAVVLSATWTAL